MMNQKDAKIEKSNIAIAAGNGPILYFHVISITKNTNMKLVLECLMSTMSEKK